MKSRVTAIAHPNIALSKYWGKAPGDLLPATPSLSLTLGPFRTETQLTRSSSGGLRLRLNGGPASPEELQRLHRVLHAFGAHDIVQSGGLEVESTNNFPTASGLASSASGLAAFALGLAALLGQDGDKERIAAAAARGSMSAARSVWAGYVEMHADGQCLHVAPAAVHPSIEMAVVVAVMTASRKSLSSSAGMRITRERSALYSAWTQTALELHQRAKAALRLGEFNALGEALEQSSFAMHGAALAAGVMYLFPQSLMIADEVRAWRESGPCGYVSFDAGPHPKVFCASVDAEAIAERLAALPGVLQVHVLRPAEGARLVS